MTLHQMTLLAEAESAVNRCVLTPSPASLSLAIAALVEAFNSKAIDVAHMVRSENIARRAYKGRARTA